MHHLLQKFERSKQGAVVGNSKTSSRKTKNLGSERGREGEKIEGDGNQGPHVKSVHAISSSLYARIPRDFKINSPPSSQGEK